MLDSLVWPTGLALRGAAVALAFAGSTALAADLNVPGDFASIQEAITAAEDGDVVIVAPGTYTGNITTLGKAVTVRSSDPASPEIVASTILDAGGEGRAIRIILGERVDTVIDGFTITGGNAGFGGGIEIALSDPTIRRCVFTGNTAGSGGAAYLSVSSAWFDRCVFEGNTATRGGAVFARSTSRARFDECSFIGNTADRGGAIASDTADVRVRGGIIRDNVATTKGGAYDGSGSRLRLSSSIVADNTASRGAAFQLENDGVNARNCTIVGNDAGDQGGVANGFQAQPIFYNCIVRDNGEVAFVSWLNPYARYSNFEGEIPGEGNIDADPLFVDAAGGDYRLQAGSPSIDAGRNGWVPSYDLRDLDGTPRIQDDTVDQGAFEAAGAFDPPSPQPGQLAVTTKDDGALAYGVPQPLWLYDLATDSWSELVRDLPAFAFTADPDGECFWLQAGDTGYLARVPYETLEIEEIGLPKLAGSPTMGASLTGMAVIDGQLYASGSPFGGGTLYMVDTASATLTEVAEFDPDYEIWDLHYDDEADRLLLLSNTGSLPSDQLGVIEYDLETGSYTTIQQWFNDNPAGEAPALQGLAVGGGLNFLYRPLYNDLEVYDASTLEQTEVLSVPLGTAILGGLSWVSDLGGGAAAMAGDVNADCLVDVQDLLIVLGAFGTENGAEWADGDLDGDGDVDTEDLLSVLAHYGDTCG